MTEDRTTPMRDQQWSQRATTDDQETVYADPEGKTPPTIPLGDQGRPDPWGPERDLRGAGPAGGYDPSTPRWEQDAGDARTMMIQERPQPVFAWLVVVDCPKKDEIGKVHTLHPDTTTIGRVRGNQLVLHDQTCSAQHARIRIERPTEGEVPAYVLYDMGSSNKTYVGNREDYRREDNIQYRHELQDGEYILIGETTLAFKRL